MGLPGGCLPKGGVYLGGVSAQRGVCLEGGVCPGGSAQGMAAHRGVWQTPPPPVNRMTDRCKTLPCSNYVADGKKLSQKQKSHKMSGII